METGSGPPGVGTGPARAALGARRGARDPLEARLASGRAPTPRRTPPHAPRPAAELKRQTATVDCPKSMVGRVIGKNGETIKALQTYSGALIQIDQTVEPTKVTISGTPHSLSLAVSMVTDIVKGTFKGFALLRQVTNAGVRPMGMPPAAPMAQPRPVYAPGYGLIPPSQVRAARAPRAAPPAWRPHQQQRRASAAAPGPRMGHAPKRRSNTASRHALKQPRHARAPVERGRRPATHRPGSCTARTTAPRALSRWGGSRARWHGRRPARLCPPRSSW
jgi:hypothetical protein